MTKQVKIYAGDDTLEKWQQICERFSSTTAAFAVVVENYFNQFNQMEVKVNAEEIPGVSPEETTIDDICKFIH